MARPVLASKGTASVVTTNAPAPTYPASVVANDVIILQVVKYDGALSGQSITTPAGFTLITTVPIFTSGGQTGIAGWYYRRATGALSGTVTITCGGATGNSTVAMAQMYRVTGCRTSGDPFDNWQSNASNTANSAVAWATFKEYHSAETLIGLFSVGASAQTQPPATPTGVTATTVADSSTTGADAYVLGYTVTTPADPTVGPFASSTSRTGWATLAINLVSASYVHSAISGSDSNGTTTESVPKLIVTDTEGQQQVWTQDYLDPFTTTLDGNWTTPYLLGTTLQSDGTRLTGQSTSADGSWNHDVISFPIGNIVRLSMDVAAVAAGTGNFIGWIGFINGVTDESVRYLLSETLAAGDEMDYFNGANTLVGGDPALVFTGWQNSDKFILEWNITTGVMTVYRVRSGVTTTMWTGSAIAGTSINAILAESAIPYVNMIATTTNKLDNFKLEHSSLPTMVTESANAVPSGGSTPKSSSDANGTTTEVTSPFIRETAPDQNGAFVEATSLGLAGSDVNGVLTENVQQIVAELTADTNGAVTEATSTKLLGADVNGLVTEAFTETVQETATDVNGTVTEGSSVTQPPTPISGTDSNGATGETAVPTATESAADANGATTEAASPTAPISATDASGAAIDGASLITTEVGTDAGTETEAASITSPVAGSDANGVTTESFQIGLAGSDANSATTEVATEAVAEASADASGPTTEAAKLNLAGADSNAVTTEVANETTVQSSTDANGVTTEAGVLAAAEASADTNGATSEAASLRLNGADAGTEAEANALVTQETATDANAVVTENATTNTPKVDTDTNSTTTEVGTLLGKPTATDAGTDTEATVLRYILAPTGDTNAATTEAASPKAVETSADANGATTESGNVVLPNLVTGTDTGTAQETAQPAAALSGTDSSASTQTALLGAYITSPDGSGSTIETATAVARIVAAELGIGLDLANLQVTVLSPDTGSAIVEAAKLGIIGADSGYGNIEAESILVNVVDTENGNAVDSEVLLIHGRVLNPDAPWALLGVKMEDAVLTGADGPGPAVLVGAKKAPGAKIVGAAKPPQEARITKAQLDATLTRVRDDG